MRVSLRICSTFSVLAVISLSIFAFVPQVSAQDSAPSGAKSPTAEKAVAAGDEPHEDWNSIKVKPGDFVAAKPLLGERDDVQNMSFVRERYQMLWRSMDPLDVYVVTPRNVEKAPVIVYLYSFPQDTDRFKDDRWCATATANGYAAIGFVSHLTGQRIHDRPVKEWFISELQESLADTAHDVQMILNYVETREDLDSHRIGMFAVGSGASVAILTAVVDPRIKAINLLSPWGDWPDWLAKSDLVPQEERATYLKPEFLAKVAPLDPVAWLPKITTDEVRIQNVRGSKTVPNECQMKIEAAAPPQAVVDQFENGRAFVPVSAGGKVFDWIKEQLQSAPTPAVAAYKPGVHHYSAQETNSLPTLPTSN
jgi:hypothetical protein